MNCYYEFVPLDIHDSCECDISKDIVSALKYDNSTIDFDMVEIHHIFVEEKCRGKGLGSKIVKEFCDSNKDSLILVVAGILDETMSVEDTLESLDRFYTKNNFININEHLGDWDITIPYIYNNDCGKYLIKKLIEYNESFMW